MFHFAIPLSAILLWLFVSSFFCFAKEVYRWTDEKGDVHLTDDLSKVPAQYQNQVERTEMKEEVPKPGEKESRKAPKASAKPKAKSDQAKEDIEYEKKIAAKKAIEEKIENLEEELKATEKELEKVKDSLVRDRKRQSREEKLKLKIRDIKKKIADHEKKLKEIKKSL